MQSTYEKGCDEVTDGSGAIDICAHCASEDKLQPGLYYCFQCGSFGRYMCGDCNIKHRKYAHEVQSISDAAQQKEQNIYSYERGCDASQDDSGATDICAHCASDSNIQPAFYFCFHCGPFGRYMCENCNKQHKKFANEHEVRKLSKEAPKTRYSNTADLPRPRTTREIRMIQPTPRQRPVPAVRTITKVDMPQLVTKPVETGKIKFSGWTDNAVDKQATAPSKNENVMSSYSVKELTAMFELLMKQRMSPYKQNISNITETRKLDSNVKKVEQHVMKMEIQAVEKETDIVNRSEKLPPRPRQRQARAEQTKAKADIAQFMTKSGEAGEKIRDSGWTDTADDSQATITSTTEKVRSSYNGNELNTLPVLHRDQGNSSNKHKKTPNMQEIRKLDSNVEKVEQQVVEMQMHAAEKNRHWNNDVFPCGHGKHCFVVAIEFGKTHTSYAVSVRYDFEKHPLQIYTPKNLSGIHAMAPTCVLFDKNKKFHSFGYVAESNYSEFSVNGEQGNYYFFRRFTRRLSNNALLNRKYVLKDETGKQMDAMDVLSASIKYLRDHFMEICMETNCNIIDEDIRWVITVPAIWNDASKQLMWKAAQMAGINGKDLLIATEPEAASMCLQYTYQPEPNFIFELFARKSKYLILDTGDSATYVADSATYFPNMQNSTIDITVYEVKDNGSIKELYKASSDACDVGCANIDRAFRDFLASIVGNDVMDNFQATNMIDYKDLFHEVELMKTMFTNDMTKIYYVHFPVSLHEEFQRANGKTINDRLKTMPEYNGQVILVRDKLKVAADIVDGWFKETCDSIASHLKSLFSKPEVQNVPTIFMVGERLKSFHWLQDVFKKTLPNKKVIIPPDPGMCVLRGAVILGHVC